MRVIVTVTDLTEEEREGLDLRATEAESGAILADASIENHYAGLLAEEVRGYAERAQRLKVEAQARLGEVFVRLPQEEQEALKRRLVEAAEAHGIDTSGL